MKKGILLLSLIFSLVRVEAQSSQVKLYLQQIAANKVLIQHIQKGYKIARTALTNIGDIKYGEFYLHSNFNASLKSINPKIKNSALVVDIIALQVQIVQSYKTNYHRFKESDQFANREINYIYSVFTRLLDNTAATLEELFTLITSGRYQMSDDERIKRLNRLYADMQSNYVFIQHFSNDANLLSLERIKAKQDIESVRAFYGIPIH